MKKRVTLLALLLALVMVLAACGGSTEPEEGAEEEAVESTQMEQEEVMEDSQVEGMKVGFVTDEGGINDQSFNQSAWEGISEAARVFGIDNSYIESTISEDYAPNLDEMVDRENELILAAGFKLGDDVYEAAKKNPDVYYAIVDNAYGSDEQPHLDNLLGILFKQEQPSFLVGYIAGRMTETDKVGFVGGIPGDVIHAFDFGYQAGVQYAAKELDKEIEVLSQYVNNFSDTAAGKSIAKNMYQDDFDIVFHAAGGAGDGVIEAAKEEDKWAIGVDRDQNDQAPEHVLTSAMKRVDVAMYNLVKTMAEGEAFPGGQTIIYGLEDDGAVDIAPTSDKNVPADILEDVAKVKQDIIDGNIVVPVNEETYNEFIDSL